jgi:hypothetical protein
MMQHLNSVLNAPVIFLEKIRQQLDEPPLEVGHGISREKQGLKGLSMRHRHGQADFH